MSNTNVALRKGFSWPAFSWDRLLFAAVLLTVAALVVYPVVLMLANSFIEGHFTPAQHWSLEPWRRALDEPAVSAAIWNTVRIVAAVELISLPCAVVLAWLIARTDVPGSRAFEFVFWIAFFVPVLSAVLGWVVLLDPQTGLINQVLKSATGVSPFDIYSFWGIVWTHLATNAIAIKVMLLAPMMRNLDATFEEAARTSGAGRLRTLRKVVLPLAVPGIVTVLVLALIRGMQTFEIEQVLGAPSNFWVFGTLIYRLIEHQPPEFGPATVLSALAIFIIAPLILCHRWLMTRKDYTTVGGRMNVEPMRLGVLRWPAFALLALVAVVLVCLPAVSLFAASFMKLFGFFNVPEPWTLANWRKVLSDDFFLHALGNTFVVAGSAALVSCLLSTLIAYFAVRSGHRGRNVLDFASWLPFALPGILFGVGLLYAILGNPILRPLYGGRTILVMALVAAHMTLGVQILKTAMVQLSGSLEEAGRVNGASWWYCFGRIIIPIVTPSIFLVAIMSFVSAARDISTIALLGNNDTKTLSLLQLDYLVDGRSESAAVISSLLILLTTGAALIGRLALGNLSAAGRRDG